MIHRLGLWWQHQKSERGGGGRSEIFYRSAAPGTSCQIISCVDIVQPFTCLLKPRTLNYGVSILPLPPTYTHTLYLTPPPLHQHHHFCQALQVCPVMKRGCQIRAKQVGIDKPWRQVYPKHWCVISVGTVLLKIGASSERLHPFE